MNNYGLNEKQADLNLLHETKGLAYLESLLMEINVDEDCFHYMEFHVCLMLIQIMVWCGMAFERKYNKKKASKNQAKVKGKRWLSRQRAMVVVKKKVLSFILITNQAKRSYIVRRIKSLLDHLKKVIWCHWIYSYMLNCVKLQSR